MPLQPALSEHSESRLQLILKIVVVVVCRLVLSTARRFAYPFAPVLSRGLGVPLTAITSLIAINQATAVLGLFFGPIADRLGYRLMMLSGMTLLVAGMFAAGLFPFYGVVLVALFLAGLEVLSSGLKQAAGGTLQTVLEKLTVNRFMGAITGAAITGILNSSSVTTVLVVGFVTAGVMTLAQSVGVIMGANIGSTATAQILAFNVSQYALIPVAIGFFMIFAGKKEQLKHYGMMVMGLGLVFYGMGIMSDGMSPLRKYEPFLELLKRMENPILGLLAGAVFTGLVQSSAATVGIAIAMASEGLLSLPAGIALAL